MQEDGLAGKKRRRFKTTTKSNPSHAFAPNLLDQQFTVDGPNIAWAGDITYLRTREGWLYLAVIIDLYSRIVVGWSISESLDSRLSTGALERAVARRAPHPGLVYHSDRGVQYTCDIHRRQLADLGIVPSMSRKGNCYDNAVLESFFDSLKTELDCDVFDTRAEARSSVFEYIEAFYNTRRRHSFLDYQTPTEFEEKLAS
jgi:transposase InsO family protein